MYQKNKKETKEKRKEMRKQAKKTKRTQRQADLLCTSPPHTHIVKRAITAHKLLWSVWS